MKFPVIDDFDLENKILLIRVDINSPLDLETKEIIDDSRIRRILPTLEALKNSKIVLLAHQSRPGSDDFTTLEKHSVRLGELIDRPIKYIDDIFGKGARDAISNLKNGEILILENVRFSSEEVADAVKKKSPEDQAKTNFVKKLSSYVDFYINDAFAVSHRNQPSVVGFPNLLPSAAGKLLEEEINGLSLALESNERPKVYALGGSKATDSLKVIQKVLDKGIADKVLTSGMVANLLLAARKVDIGIGNLKGLRDKGYDCLIPEVEILLEKYGDKIITPVDMAYDKDGKRMEAPAESFPDEPALDIGSKTIDIYKEEIEKAKIVAANGPCGVFEIEEFAKGSKELSEAMAGSDAFTVIGGGHLSAVAQKMGLGSKISYISTAGKASLLFLAGEKLPGLEALKKSGG